MTVSGGTNSSLPWISVGMAILIFGFFSWFHFYKPILGAVSLMLAFVFLYLTWPFGLLVEYFGESSYKPSPIEFLTPLVLGLLAILFAWKSRDSHLNKWLKLVLDIPPALFAIYIGGFMVLRLIG